MKRAAPFYLFIPVSAELLRRPDPPGQSPGPRRRCPASKWSPSPGCRCPHPVHPPCTAPSSWCSNPATMESMVDAMRLFRLPQVLSLHAGGFKLRVESPAASGWWEDNSSGKSRCGLSFWGSSSTARKILEVISSSRSILAERTGSNGVVGPPIPRRMPEYPSLRLLGRLLRSSLLPFLPLPFSAPHPPFRCGRGIQVPYSDTPCRRSIPCRSSCPDHAPLAFPGIPVSGPALPPAWPPRSPSTARYFFVPLELAVHGDTAAKQCHAPPRQPPNTAAGPGSKVPSSSPTRRGRQWGRSLQEYQ